jgi:PleD family two-component response regulator
MPDSPVFRRHQLVLIASGQEWSTRSLETILGPNGFEVRRAYTGARAVEEARLAQPDVIIVESSLPDEDGLDVCRRLRRESQVSPSTPILLISAEPPTRQRRIDALRAGAWDHFAQPLDAEEFLLRIQAFSHAKRDADRARDDGLLDWDTGLYNMRGVARRAQELGSQAARSHSALGCIVLAPEFDTTDESAVEAHVANAVPLLAHVFKAVGRRSDAIGRLGRTEFALVALDANAAGCVKAAERLANAVDFAPGAFSIPPFALRAGYYSVADFHEAPVDPVETIFRATAALRLARSDPAGGWLRGFTNGIGASTPHV